MASIAELTLPDGTTYDLKDKYKADKTTVAPVESSTTATAAHALGSTFYLNDILYRALEDIDIGDTIVTTSGGNAVQTSVAANFKRIVTLTSEEYELLTAAEKAADIVYIITNDNTVAAANVSYDNTDSGLETDNAQDAIDEVKTLVDGKVPVYGMGENLLRNAYFVNPVNQRGETSGTTGNQTYFINCWKTSYGSSAGTWALSSNGLTLTPGSSSANVQCIQPLDDAPFNGKQLTASILYSDGSLIWGTITRATGTNQYFDSDNTLRMVSTPDFRFYTRTTKTVVAVKLELGTEQTLAHLEGSTWVLNEIPDYEAELLKCQTSMADASDIYANKIVGVNVSNENLLRNWYFPNPVNQRNFTTITTTTNLFTIDCWQKNGGAGTASIQADGMNLVGTSTTFCFIRQFIKFSSIAGKTVTVSALLSSGEIISTTGTFPTVLQTSVSITLSTSTATIQVTALTTGDTYAGIRALGTTAITVVAMKLEIGTEQTIAHKENGVWVLNEVPDYEEELIKCQTSTADSTDTYANKSLATEQELAYVETGTTASRAYVVGEYFCRNGQTCRAKTAIAQGATLTLDTNYEVPAGGGLNDIVNRRVPESLYEPSTPTNVTSGGQITLSESTTNYTWIVVVFDANNTSRRAVVTMPREAIKYGAYYPINVGNQNGSVRIGSVTGYDEKINIIEQTLTALRVVRVYGIR